MTDNLPTPRTGPTAPMDRLGYVRGLGITAAQRAARLTSDEQAAWLGGVHSVLGAPVPAPSVPSPASTLPTPPEGWVWAEAGNHVLQGSIGLVHLVNETTGPESARCGLTARLWISVGSHETQPREACGPCAGQRVIV